MNIEEYRALKAQEAQASQEQQQVESKGGQPDVQTQQAAPDDTQQVAQETTQAHHTPIEGGTQAEAVEPQAYTTPDYVEIDGKQVPLEELKGGYLRQSDYTSKTQQLAKEKKELELAKQYYDAVNSNPEFAQDLAKSFNLPYKTPEEAKYEELNLKYHETLLNQEISDLKARYADFDEVAVVNMATEKGISSLEDAYLLTKAKQPERGADLDIDALTEQIRQSVLKDLQSQVDTSTIISAGGDTASITQTEPELTAQERKVARGLKLTDEEYRNAKKRR
jgi:hypothetical protein